MKNFKLRISIITLVAFFSFNYSALAQVGIGTISPDPSSMLDVSSTEKGILAPRMTSAQRIAIASPAEGLLVFDTDEDVFYFYDSTAWLPLEGAEKRDNYKLVKDISDLSAELIAGGGSKYLLDENYLYEINGTIDFDFPVDLNGAYITGRDTGEDALVNNSGATFFSGTKGGHFKDLVLRGNGQQIFNITGSGTESLIAYSLIIVGASSVGTLSDLSTVFFEVFQIVATADGLQATDVANFYMDKIFWTDSNGGTFLKLSGTFANLQMANGRVVTDAGETGIDVSSNPIISVAASLAQVNFTGDGTRVSGYSPSIYSGYYFNNNWTVDCPGIPVEYDDVATGNIYYNGTITTGFVQTIGDDSPLNLTGDTSNLNSTTAVNLFRMSSSVDNRLTYLGNKTRTFQISASLSVRGNSGTGTYYGFFIRKNGSNTLVETNTLMRVNNTSDINSLSISGTVELSPNDYIEVWGQRLGGSGTSITVFSLNLNIK